MSFAKASLTPGKQSPRRFGSRASACAVGDSAGRYTSEQSLRSIAWLENGGSWTLSMPQAAESPLHFAFCCLLPCFPAFASRAGEAENGPEGPMQSVDFLDEIWSGRRDSNPRPQPWQGWDLKRPLVPELDRRNTFLKHPRQPSAYFP
jgi:hypothetical protein